MAAVVHRVFGGGGLELRVDETGSPDGRPILFIHGFSQCRLSWRRQFDATSPLAERFRLVALDIRGHGGSAKPPDVYGESKLWADDVAAVIEQLGLDHPVLVGWSYGGVIMADYLSIHGEDAIAGTNWVGAVSKLGAPVMPFLDDRFVALVPGFYSTDAVESAAALSAFMRLCVHDEPAPDDFFYALGYNTIVPSHVRRALFARTLDHTETLGRLGRPALVTHGADDAVVRPTSGEAIAAAIPNAQLSLYPGVGHAPFLEAPDRFNAELADFVDRL
ncbi:MAG: alpha/beta fold hydrolase [Acidimicrobiales bacterium]